MVKEHIFLSIGIIVSLLLCLQIPCAFSAALSAEAVYSGTDVFVGEALTLQIQVSGSESPEKPDLSSLDGFAVAFQGGSQNSSSTITIINGQMTRNVREGYVFSYQLTPMREGRLVIPPITVRAGTQTAATHSVVIYAKKPVETDNFKLRMKLSKNHCYVGEPVVLTVTWYIGTQIQNANFTLPFMEKQDWFYIQDPKVDTSGSKQFFKIPAGNGEVVAEKGQDKIQDQSFVTLTFEKVLIPKKAGAITLDPATVSCQALVGYRNQGSPFGDDFFSKFFNSNNSGFGRQGVYRQAVVPSNPLTLDIADVPLQGRPADFSGLVGQYHIDASAKPTAVNVGDPITLTLTVSGPEYLDPVQLPMLDQQADLSQNFKIPAERSTGEISGNKKTFTQTLRPLRADVKEIPPIRLTYFDTQSQSYKAAATNPIPLTVSPARIVTAKDAEGIGSPAPAGKDVETYAAGIIHNYDDSDALISQVHDPAAWARSQSGLCVLIIPPFFYLLLFAGSVVYRRKKADPHGAKIKKAGPRLAKAISAAKHSANPREAKVLLLDGIKTYLGDKLRMPAGALTFNDVRDPLTQKGADINSLDTLKKLFADCEAARYGSSVSEDTIEQTAAQALDLMKKLERLLK